MKDRKHELGAYGERLAVTFLQHEGYAIVETNWHCEHGELDIVAQRGETLVFVEVRTRHSSSTDLAFMSVDARKQEKLVNLAQVYLAMHDREDAVWRIDVIGIAVPRKGQPIIEHVEDALDWQ